MIFLISHGHSFRVKLRIKIKILTQTLSCIGKSRERFITDLRIKGKVR